MKIIVIGGTGLIGSKVVSELNAKGHQAIAASPSRGINTLTGEGLDDALKGADIVIDVSNSPSFEDKQVLEFFNTSTSNLLKAEEKAGVRHHVALSVVGTDLLTGSGYFRAKQVQENLIKSSPIPYTIVRATQFFEFINSILEGCVVGETIHAPIAAIQPMASDDVAKAVVEFALQEPKNGIIDIAGPVRFQFAEILEKYLNSIHDGRKVIPDGNAQYFGIKLNNLELVPQKDAHLGPTTFEKWLQEQK